MADIQIIQRYELKYTITESLARQIREYIRPICSLDRHASPETRGYTVNNLYFETPDLRFYYDVKFRRLMRVKPRVRFYGKKAEDFCWLELKHKFNNVIWKRRNMIPLAQWPAILEREPQPPGPTLCKERPETFEEILGVFGARPLLHVRYFREPYVSEIEEYGRVTFDRRLCYQKAHGSTQLEADEHSMLYYDDPISTRNDDSPVILEVKTTQSVPLWMLNMIRQFGLLQRGFSKYCYAVDRIMEGTSGARDYPAL